MSFDPPLIWFLVGLGLVLMEFMIPGTITVFFGFGAWIAALTTWLGFTSSLAWQLIVFSVSSVLLLLLLRRRLRDQFLGHSSGDQRGTVFLQLFDVGVDLSDQRVDLGGFSIQKLTDRILLIDRRNRNEGCLEMRCLYSLSG